jgi:hypothetical protein
MALMSVMGAPLSTSARWVAIRSSSVISGSMGCSTIEDAPPEIR